MKTIFGIQIYIIALLLCYKIGIQDAN